ncbi:MAG: hypothetical protein LBU32_14230, partial [Clostridiales bacterium]|nr:hypothetical protein [Clostridiales bacterium]
NINTTKKKKKLFFHYYNPSSPNPRPPTPHYMYNQAPKKKHLMKSGIRSPTDDCPLARDKK